MSLKRAAIASRLRMALLLALLFGGILLARSHVSGVSPIDQVGTALQRIALVAASDTAQLGLLVIVCFGLGVLVVIDRRRRSKVRQASC